MWRMNIPKPLYSTNEALAFLLELCALAALGWWGFTTGTGIAIHVLLGVGAPVLAAVVWAMFAAPKARVRLSRAAVLVVKILVFGAAAAALAAQGQHILTIVFVVVVLTNLGIANLTKPSQA